MSNVRETSPSRWVSRLVHGILVSALLIVIGFRVYGYFASSESSLNSPREALDSNDVGKWRAVGNEAFGGERWETAAEAFTKVTQREPNNLRAWARLAIALYQTQRYEEAIAANLRVSQFDGTARSWGLFNVARVYAVKNEKRMALDYLQEAVEAGLRRTDPIGKNPEWKSFLDDPEFRRLEELAKPVSRRSAYRQFDFLLGKWTLLTHRDRRMGSLEFSRQNDGYALLGTCVDDANAITSTIFVYYEPESRTWRQVWLDEKGSVMHLAGMPTDLNTIELTGLTASADGRQNRAKAVFREVEGGMVHLSVMKSPDGGTNWDPLIDTTLAPDDRRPSNSRSRNKRRSS